ncbi:ImmA/IrrE family metallo-endopeptidase [Mameliella sp. CS4]|uniref:ImmA/IrrE family metallo-endopeptidase n=1 Tax=Mameliella sp. CS4 TaxID=2862329 RepID=UPI001C5E5B9D|nr:ImmA/IrrE family metallo-endopeptidase [Mameliella sp. CS4]MBW4985874.1 ImmA/IrrE family metallo-endopeptidase [Mameliella sp. CS4]
MSDNRLLIDPYAAQDIDESVNRILRDLGNPEPPLRLEEVRELLRLDLTYYSKADLDLLDEISHRAVMAGSTIMSNAKRMWDVVTKVGLRGLLVPEQRQIFIDDDVPDLKKRFLIGHEISHDFIPWHRSLMMGDNNETISPICHNTMEAEANYGSRRLIFLGDRFAAEWRDTSGFDWKRVSAIGKTFGNTLTTTLWELVHSSPPDLPALGMISVHPRHNGFCKRAGSGKVAYFFGSGSFNTQFSNVTKEQVFSEICSYVGYRKQGPLGEGVQTLANVNGELFDFEFSTFCNRYDVLTYATMIGPHRRIVGF